MPCGPGKLEGGHPQGALVPDMLQVPGIHALGSHDSPLPGLGMGTLAPLYLS